MRHRGTITHWNDEKGYGFISPVSKSDRVFVHVKAILPGQPRPVGAELVSFELGKDDQGRLRALKVQFVDGQKNSSTVFGTGVATLIGAGFVASLLGSSLATVLPLWIPAIYVVMSLLTVWAYREDKDRAQQAARRTPEDTLHLLELLGGWPGALIAQQWFRHKNRKESYQAGFWLIVVIHLLFWGWFLVQRPDWFGK